MAADKFDQQSRIKNTERLERVRQAVIKRRGNVTVGDIVTETGFTPDVAEDSLKELIMTHEGTMRVSENGEILYAFTPNCISRDYRSWWDRSKDAFMKGFKIFAKVMIMLIMVVYFIIYLLIFLALLFSGRNNNDNSSSNSNFDIGWMIYIFWGRGDYDQSERREKVEPLYTRTYKFIFGPEEEKEDPMQLQKDFAQLVRAKDGVITVEDWMVVSGHMMPQCESEIARYTAIYNGEAEICEDGTLVYIFKDLMKSTDNSLRTRSPDPAWKRLQKKKPLTGNKSNIAVILMNSFNLIMSSIFVFAAYWLVTTDPTTLVGAEQQKFMALQLLNGESNVLMFLGIIPFIYSLCVFAGPLLRMPSTTKENAKRRRDNIRKVVLENVNNARTGATVVGAAALQNVNHGLRVNNFTDQANVDEINSVLDTVAVDMNAQVADGGYRFEDLKTHTERAFEVREKLRLDQQDLGRVIFSTDSNDREASKNYEEEELASFDRELSRSRNQSMLNEPNQSLVSARAAYDTDYRAKRRENDDRSRSAY